MKITEFVENYKAKRFISIRQGVDEKSEWLKKELEIKKYIPFRIKRQIAEMIVSQNISNIDGFKKYNSIDGYISFMMASITAHTNLQCSKDPIADYDLLAESDLLPQIVAEFQESHDEIDTLRKMVVAMELEDNSTSALIGRFLDNILKKLDNTTGVLNDMLGNIDLNKIFNDESMAKIISLLNK